VIPTGLGGRRCHAGGTILVVDLARKRGIEAGGVADSSALGWLTLRPGQTVYDGAMRLIDRDVSTSTADHGGLHARM
jgi:hypothetical protein